jgi:hypothetical protein
MSTEPATPPHVGLGLAGIYCNSNYNLNYLNCRKLQLWIRCSPTVTPSAWDPSTSELRDIC